MFQRKSLLALAGSVFLGFAAVSCADQYDGRMGNSSYERVPARDQFVGSIYFATGSSSLSKAALADLRRMAERIQDRRYNAARIILVGYADRERGVEENAELAAERAQRVAMALEKRGIELERIIIDSRAVRMTRAREAERRVDIYTENSQGNFRMNTLFPVLIGFFLLVTFGIAVIIFRRRR